MRRLRDFSFIYHLSFAQKGFTLIELLVVMVIIVTLSVVSIQSTIDYNRKQTLDSVTNELANAMRTARSRALSQTKSLGGTSGATSCANKSLEAFRVQIDTTNRQYIQYVICNQLGVINPTPTPVEILPRARAFPASIKITLKSNNRYFDFKVLTGAVSYEINQPPCPCFVQLEEQHKSGVKRRIDIYSDGRIVIS